MPKTPKMRYCFNCGAELGVYADYDQLDTCGKSECEREVGNALREERDRAHDDLDRSRGWGDYDGRY